ncbi:MAG: hypothetical protein Q4B15_01960 [Lachnospiraceae bacterium]|nr:hypothetical protein [Lachnospiraceae bacterium]
MSMDLSKAFANLRALFSKKKKPSREEVVLDAKVDLRELELQYKNHLAIQRQILKNNPTPHVREVAQNEIRSGICAYAVVKQAQSELNAISSDLDLSQSLGKLGVTLQSINRLQNDGGRKKAQKQVNKGIGAMFKREHKRTPDELFTDESLAAVDSWLGTAWDDVASKYENGSSLQDCLRDTTIILESNPLPGMDRIATDDYALGTDYLNDLMNFKG